VTASGIRFSDVHYRYPAPGGAVDALRGVSLHVHPGELVAVVGPNGSGKSTLGLLSNGLLAPNMGSVTVDGLDSTDASHTWDVRSSVGVVFQNPDNQIVGTVVEEDVAFGPENLGLPREEIRMRVDRALATVGLTGLERREPHLLSGGQKQRLAIAGVLALDPRYMLFDEPTAMLDPAGRTDVLDLIERLRSDGRGIIHITHHLADIATADRVLVLLSGRAGFLGTPSELLESPGQLAEWGLELPPIMRLTAALRDAGYDLPLSEVRPEMIAGALWP